MYYNKTHIVFNPLKIPSLVLNPSYSFPYIEPLLQVMIILSLV